MELSKQQQMVMVIYENIDVGTAVLGLFFYYHHNLLLQWKLIAPRVKRNHLLDVFLCAAMFSVFFSFFFSPIYAKTKNILPKTVY